MAKKIENNGKSDHDKQKTCGIIMPISGNENYSTEHWADVKLILDEVIQDAGFIPSLVSDADDVGIIHNRIVSNIYTNPIVVCDVSSKNPNVMFELGLRLAFDKATIIIKDNKTSYNFDTAPIEHITYPSDLRYGVINKFKSTLKDKLKHTYDASLDPTYSTFLKNFIQYKPKIEEKEVSYPEYLNKAISQMTRELAEIRRAIQVYDDGALRVLKTPYTSINKKMIFNDLVSSYIDKKITSSQRELTVDDFIKFIEENAPALAKEDMASLKDLFFFHLTKRLTLIKDKEK